MVVGIRDHKVVKERVGVAVGDDKVESGEVTTRTIELNTVHVNSALSTECGSKGFIYQHSNEEV